MSAAGKGSPPAPTVMKALLVNRFFWPDASGTAGMLADLAEDLAAAGVEVTVLTGDSAAADPSRRYARAERWRGVRIVRVRAARFDRQTIRGWLLNALGFYPAALVRLLTLPRYDLVVYLTDPPLVFALGPLVRLVRGGRYVCWCHDLYPDVAVAAGVLTPRSALARAAGAVARFALRRADRVVAIGETMAGRLAAGGVEPARLAVIHNWADGRRVRPHPRGDQAVRARFGLGYRRHQFIVMYSGNMGLAHDLDVLVEAARRLAGRDDIRWLVAGGGKQHARIRAAAAGLDRMSFVPFQPERELSRSLGAADALVVTLRPGFEGIVLPSKVYGVLAAARPVLFAGPAGCEIAGMVADAACGLVIPPGDAAGLAAAVETLAGDPGRAERMGAAGRALFDRRFDRPLATRSHRRVLQAALGLGNRPGALGNCAGVAKDSPEFRP